MDVGIIRLVVAILGAVCVLCVAGIAALSVLGKTEPDSLKIALATGIGGLVGILANQRPSGPSPPAPQTAGS
jgi:hypothetical protein